MGSNQGWSAGEENNGVFSATQNDNPTSSGVVLQERAPTPAPALQKMQQTAVRGTDPATVVAADVSLHDSLGNAISTANPLPVVLTDGSINIGTINANLEVALTAKDNDPKPGDVHDSIRIGDGTNEMKVNTDGSINVNVSLEPVATSTPVNVYNEVNSVASGVQTTVATYLVPAGKTAVLLRTEFGGENIGAYSVQVNGSNIAKARTYFGGNLSLALEFGLPSNQGYSLVSGDVVTVKVLHSRPSLSSHEARVQLILI